MTLAEHVLRSIRRHDLIARGGRVLVALSGGPDSVALLAILRELESAGEFVVAGAAHLNHQLRGDAADADERFCRELAASLNLPIDVERADVRNTARQQKRSVEDAARALRYAFLERAADRVDAERIAVGHTRDDQAETFLLRVMRGAGTRGLGAIRPRAGRVIRPLIDVARDDLRQYAADRHLAFRDDATNLDVSIPRNRVRHELIPYLTREFSPGIVNVLAREAALARDDDEYLERQAIDLAGTIVLRTEQHVEIDRAALLLVHRAIGSRIARLALGHLAEGSFVGFEQTERLLQFAGAAREGESVSLPGQQAVCRGLTITLRREPGRRIEKPNISGVPLSIPGEVQFASGWSVSAVWADSGDGAPVGLVDTVAVAGPALALPLAIRTRRPGDRFQPPGMGGKTKKLQDFFVDRKVPRETRDALPLVVDGQDRIVWVVGMSVAEDFRVAAPSQGVIFLKARRLGH